MLLVFPINGKSELLSFKFHRHRLLNVTDLLLVAISF